MSEDQICDSTVDGDNYLEMLKSYFFPILQKKKRLTKQIIFQQDGTPLIIPSKSVTGWMKNSQVNG